MIESVDLSDTFSFTKKCNRDIILWLYIDREKTVKLFSRIVLEFGWAIFQTLGFPPRRASRFVLSHRGEEEDEGER